METVENSLQTGNFPIGMSRQVNKPTQFIKLSSPKDAATAKITQNTLTWMNKNMLNLQKHYTQLTCDLMENVQNFSELEWTVAVKWTKNRFRHKLRDSTLNLCKATTKNKQTNSSLEYISPTFICNCPSTSQLSTGPR